MGDAYEEQIGLNETIKGLREGWTEERNRYRGILEKIATTPGCPKSIYNLAADTLNWARKHETSENESDPEVKP